MRIAHCLRALIAVLSLAAAFNPVASNEQLNDSIFQTPKHNIRKHHRMHEWYDLYYNHASSLDNAGRLLTPRENQLLLKQEMRNNRTAVDCCPSVLEMVEPEGGKNQDDKYVELYRNGNDRQRFYELSCHQDILNKPCRFMDRKLHNNSRCVQKYSYTYALVKDTGKHHHHLPSISTGPNETKWALDYIRVRSGCSCVVQPNYKKKRDKSKNKRRHED